MQEFEWDEAKARGNFIKHGVSFDETRTVFTDIFGLEEFDERHSESEERWILVGTSSLERILVVVYTERNSHIRLISSRKANAKERKKYTAYRGFRGG